MREIFQNSVIFRAVTAAAAWIDRQWSKSTAAAAFLREGRGEEASRASIFFALWELIRRIISFIFEKLRLEKIFTGSIFSHLFWWCAAAAVLAPLIPTMALIAIVAAGYVSFVIALGLDNKFDVVWAPTHKYVLIFALIYAISTVTSVNRSASLAGGALTVFFLLFSIVFASSVKDRRQLDAVLRLLMAAGALVALYGIYQYVTGDAGADAWIDSDMFSTVETRVYSTLENPNVLSEYLLLVIPLTVSVCITAGSKRLRAASAAAAALMALCMVLTFSRGGWLGLIFAAALFMVLLDRRMIVVGLAAAVVLVFFLPETIISRFTSIGNLSDGSTSYRLYIWMGTLAMLKDYWMCGIGTGTGAFTSVYPAYSYNAIVAPHAHNLFLQITTECGVWGLLMLLAVIFSFFRCVSGALSRAADKKDRVLLIGALSGMTGFLVQSMTDHSFYNYRVTFLFWIFTALGTVIARLSRSPEDEK